MLKSDSRIVSDSVGLKMLKFWTPGFSEMNMRIFKNKLKSTTRWLKHSVHLFFKQKINGPIRKAPFQKSLNRRQSAVYVLIIEISCSYRKYDNPWTESVLFQKNHLTLWLQGRDTFGPVVFEFMIIRISGYFSRKIGLKVKIRFMRKLVILSVLRIFSYNYCLLIVAVCVAVCGILLVWVRFFVATIFKFFRKSLTQTWLNLSEVQSVQPTTLVQKPPIP